MALVEQRRIATGMTRTAVARLCGMSQGHFSKIQSGKAPLAAKARAQLEDWLTKGGIEPAQSREAALIAEMTSLAGNIRQECDRLVALAQRVRI